MYSNLHKYRFQEHNMHSPAFSTACSCSSTAWHFRRCYSLLAQSFRVCLVTWWNRSHLAVEAKTDTWPASAADAIQRSRSPEIDK